MVMMKTMKKKTWSSFDTTESRSLSDAVMDFRSRPISTHCRTEAERMTIPKRDGQPASVGNSPGEPRNRFVTARHVHQHPVRAHKIEAPPEQHVVELLDRPVEELYNEPGRGCLLGAERAQRRGRFDAGDPASDSRQLDRLRSLTATDIEHGHAGDDVA